MSEPALGRRVLVVDDNRDLTTAMANALRIWGSIVEVAYEGLEALAAAHDFHPDVVLLDLDLPGLDGFGVAAGLRDDPALRGVRIVALSGYDDKQSPTPTVGLFDVRLTKPVQLASLAPLIAKTA